MPPISNNTNIDTSRIGFRISYRYIRYIYLAVFIFLAFRTFQYFPGMPVVTELSYVLTFLLLVFVYTSWKMQTNWHFSIFELYVLAITILIPFYSGIMAWWVFGQPVIFGVLAKRSMVLSSGVLLLILAVRRGIVRISDLDSVLVGLGWLCLFLYIFMDLSLDPGHFSDYGIGFVNGVGSNMRFRFQLNIMVFVFFYYAFIGFRRRSPYHYALASIFLIFILIGGYRSLLVCMLAAFVFFVWRWSTFIRLVRFIPSALISGAILLCLLYFIDVSYFNSLYDRFSDAFTVILKGQMTQDSSANARILETVTAIPYIEKHWFFGNGVISHQWHGGYEKVLGAYFYPSDIGVIGVLYEYGIFGLLLFASQFIVALRYARRISSRQMPPFPLLDATKAFLLYYALRSLITGEFVYYSDVSIFFVTVLACIDYQGLNIPTMIRHPSMALTQ